MEIGARALCANETGHGPRGTYDLLTICVGQDVMCFKGEDIPRIQTALQHVSEPHTFDGDAVLLEVQVHECEASV